MPDTVRVHILFFGMLKDIVGRHRDELDLPEGSAVTDVLAHYQSQVPSLKDSFHSIAIAVNQQYARPETTLKAGDEIALLPPVSGGTGRLS